MPPVKRSDVLAYASAQLGGEPEYLWSGDPDAAVLRRSDNRKWYALLMKVPRERLGLDGGETADVLVIKCDPLLIGTLRQREGFLPAYHMNKENWITLLLDGPVSQEDAFSLLELSFELAAPKLRRAQTKGAT